MAHQVQKSFYLALAAVVLLVIILGTMGIPNWISSPAPTPQPALIAQATNTVAQSNTTTSPLPPISSITLQPTPRLGTTPTAVTNATATLSPTRQITQPPMILGAPSPTPTPTAVFYLFKTTKTLSTVVYPKGGELTVDNNRSLLISEGALTISASGYKSRRLKINIAVEQLAIQDGKITVRPREKTRIFSAVDGTVIGELVLNCQSNPCEWSVEVKGSNPINGALVNVIGEVWVDEDLLQSQ